MVKHRQGSRGMSQGDPVMGSLRKSHTEIRAVCFSGQLAPRIEIALARIGYRVATIAVSSHIVIVRRFAAFASRRDDLCSWRVHPKRANA